MANPARVSLALEAAPLTAYRVGAIALCILIAVVDGLDFVSIGVVAPLMMPDLGLGPAQLGAILALTQIGAAIGAVSLGRAADRYGRRPLILLSLLLIALFTLLTPLARDFGLLLVVRFMVGLALTGALPATIALVTELAPRRRRGTFVALVVAGFPLGAAIGSFVGGAVAIRFGWQSVFHMGALLALLLALIVWWRLPESPRFLATRDNRGHRMAATLPRLAPQTDLARLWEPLPRRHAAGGEPQADGPESFGALLRGELLRPTLMLWAMLLCSGMLSNVTLVWMPTILTDAGLSLAFAASLVGALNIGATVGMAVAGRLLEWAGARLTVGMAFAVAAAATAGLGIQGEGAAMIATAALLGLFLGITTSAGYALSALIYPTGVRSTGIGAGAAALRVGTVVAPLVMPALLGLALSARWTFAAVAAVPLLAAILASRFGARRPG